MKRSSAQRGYSLVEALVVVAIVGLVSLVTVPNFISYMRSAKLKTGSREFMTDLREVRQSAVTRYQPTKIAFKTGTDSSSYIIADGQYDNTVPGGIAWTTVSTKQFEPMVYFESSTVADGPDSDDFADVLFRPNGTITMVDSSGNPLQSGSIVIKTTDDVPVDSYTVGLSTSGKVSLN